ncbi:hypothetical protein FHS18_005777 [Paenibacillus phyllosphaerae]|uniref:SLH domain-containing protein n=1 Tax=Paenibacillus phyllosphaerae TaxID=274593 RepID=A0A7W5B3T4_9BACL|nr:S-layer homology domain-containing protein [Paenibacillus phyllosphaerae]MBB3113664.1 hypothetical protein [Paenibacillus phyllosphaerae]
MKKAMLKKAAVTSMAVLTLAGGATSAFADGKGNGNGNNKDKYESSKENKGNGGKKEVNINVNFKDEKELKWALEYIVRLASKGVFNGYEDGTFKPNKEITRIEAIVAAVRLMGLKEQAESAEELATELNFKDADQLEKKYPWAVGYVAVALEKDLFAETDASIQADKSATRLFAATLLVKALGLEAEAKAKSNTALNFKDAKNIPAASVGYVAVALEKKLITGYNDNTFRPNQPVTRAELAALLDRTDEQMPDNDEDAQAITGTLKAAASNGSITIVKADKTEVTVPLASNVFIFRNDVKSSISALKAGDDVMVRTYEGKAVFVEVTDSAEEAVEASFSGSVKAAVADNKVTIVKADKSEVTVPLTDNAFIYRNGVKVAASALVAGDEVLVRTFEGKVIFIEVTKNGETAIEASITGALKAAVADNKVTIVKADKSEVTVTLASNVFVFRDGVKVEASALKAGDEVLVRTDDSKAIFIEVTKKAPETTVVTYEGKLNSVILNASGKIATVSLTQEVTGGTQALVLNVAETVVIEGDASDLVAGAEVEVTLTNGLVTKIEVE